MVRASIESSPNLSRRDLTCIGATVILGCGSYLLAAALTYHLGFPLDDSWIHLTYARNLAFYGQWAFRLGRASAGSTAPLWTLALVPGFWLHLEPLWWSYALGGASLFLLGVLGEKTMRRLVAAYRPKLPWAGLFLAGEWHMLWAASAGMETLFHALLVSLVIVLLLTGSRRYLTLGLLTGLSVWVRPDGITLAPVTLMTILLVSKSNRDGVRALISFLLGLGLLLLPYLVFNLHLAGAPFPNTFYAKQAEYAAWQASALVNRTGLTLLQLLIGPGLLLVPGVIGAAWLAARRRDAVALTALLWCGGYIFMYALRLPPYQHGRYLMPAMPVLFLFGLRGQLEFSASNLLGRRHLALQRAWQFSLILLSLGFVVVGARGYGQDVGLIESEMVNTAKWVHTNLPPDAVIAAHDIGALGYFDQHRLLDLAGLVSPEVLPFMSDEPRLAEFLDDRGANYLVVFPSSYPALTRASEPVYSTGGRFAPAMGQQNMTVYCWMCH